MGSAEEIFTGFNVSTRALGRSQKGIVQGANEVSGCWPGSAGVGGLAAPQPRGVVRNPSSSRKDHLAMPEAARMVETDARLRQGSRDGQGRSRAPPRDRLQNMSSLSSFLRPREGQRTDSLESTHAHPRISSSHGDWFRADLVLRRGELPGEAPNRHWDGGSFQRSL